MTPPLAVVTGAGRGVGAATARALADDGFTVAVMARSTEEVNEVAQSIEKDGGSAFGVSCDVTSQESVQHAFEAVAATVGGTVDLLVNNAGRAHAVGLPWEVDVDDWWMDVAVNLKGPFLCARAVLPGMIERQSGCIVNVASLAAMQPYPYALAYSVAKAALVRFTDSLAAAVRQFGIGVFAISPGLVRTALLGDLAESEAGKELLPEFGEKTESDYNQPAEAGELVVALASGRADSLSGRFIHVSDDLDAMLERADDIEARDLHVLRLRTWHDHDSVNQVISHGR